MTIEKESPSTATEHEEPRALVHDLFVYSKKIKEKQLNGGKVTRSIDKTNISSVITSLEEIGENEPFRSFELHNNCVEWIEGILDGFDESKLTMLRFLVNDFTDSMMTRMREEDKYVISIVTHNFLLLCHSRGGQTTITPTWEVVKRMMDKDNVDRFVFFFKEGHGIRVNYYEYTHTESFSNWLGIPERKAFSYLGGTNRLYSRIEGLPVVLELDDDEIEKAFSDKAGRLDMDRGVLALKTPLQAIPIERVRAGKKSFDSMPDFMQNFILKKYDLAFYRDEYQKLVKSLSPLSSQFIDDAEAVVEMDAGVEKVYLRKRNPSIHVLFCGRLAYCASIEIRPSFLGSLFVDFLNRKPTHIYHAGMELYRPPRTPLAIGSMLILNNLEASRVTEQLVTWFNQAPFRDAFMERAVGYAIFDLLQKQNEKKPIVLFLDLFKKELKKNISEPSYIFANEGSVVEYKSRDYLVGKNEEVSKRIAADIARKLKESPFKVYVLGVDETTHELEVSSESRWPNDRIGKIEESILKELSGGTELSITAVPVNGSCVLLMCVRAGTN